MSIRPRRRGQPTEIHCRPGKYRDGNADDDEKPQHRVTISRPFYLGVTEVTQGQWEAVMGTEPWIKRNDVEEGSDYPATHVSWEDAVEFCQKLSSQEGRQFRLPTEAEWEYACRCGSTTVYSFGDDAAQLGDYAWFAGTANQRAEYYLHRVGQKKSNPFGLYDMHGHVSEWCSDWYEMDYYERSPQMNPTGPEKGSFRVLRGGNWYVFARLCRSSFRYGYDPTYRNYFLGFRVAFVPSSE